MGKKNDAPKNKYDTKSERVWQGIPNIVSREYVAQRSADHLCKIRMKAAFENKKNFKWPVLRGYPHFFKNVKML